jgi:hypothetical protein
MTPPRRSTAQLHCYFQHTLQGDHVVMAEGWVDMYTHLAVQLQAHPWPRLLPPPPCCPTMLLPPGVCLTLHQPLTHQEQALISGVSHPDDSAKSREAMRSCKGGEESLTPARCAVWGAPWRVSSAQATCWGTLSCPAPQAADCWGGHRATHPRCCCCRLPAWRCC